jgi:SAM-dependent methyltransferase
VQHQVATRGFKLKLIPKRFREFRHVSSRNWLSHHFLIQFLRDAAKQHATGRLVDIGCGTKPYVSVFNPYVSQHLGVDMEKCPHGTDAVDVVGTAYDTTLPDNFCDTILCSEVLEHLEEPQRAVNEMYRILKIGGKVMLTVPFFWPVHEAPRDFYRYTNFGLRHLFETGSFEIVEIKPLTGFSAMHIQMFIYGTSCFKKVWLVWPLIRIFHHLLQYLALVLDKFESRPQYTNMYGLVAVKNPK